MLSEKNNISNIRYMDLTWGNEDHINTILTQMNGGKIDVILATDVIYCNEIVQPLVDTLTKICTHETEILLG